MRRHLVRLLSIALVAVTLWACLPQQAAPQQRARRPAANNSSPAPVQPAFVAPEQMPKLLRDLFQKQLDEESAPRTAHLQRVKRWAAQLETQLAAPNGDGYLFHLAQAQQVAGLFDQAEQNLQRILQSYPDSRYVPDSRAQLVPLLLMGRIDLPRARETLAAALGWEQDSIDWEHLPLPLTSEEAAQRLREYDQAHPPQADRGTPVARADEPLNVRPARSNYEVAGDVRLYAALLAHLAGDFDAAREHAAKSLRVYQAAARLAPVDREQDYLFKFFLIYDPLRVPTPAETADGDPDAAQFIRLGDIVQETQFSETRPALQYWTRLQAARKGELSNAQRSYVLFRQARARYGLVNPLEKDPAQCLKDYHQSEKLAPTAPWSASALYLGANIHWNYYAELDDAVRLWHLVLKKHPESSDAEEAAFAVGFACESAQRWREAKSAYDAALAQYPKSGHAQFARQHLAAVDEELRRAPVGRAPRPR